MTDLNFIKSLDVVENFGKAARPGNFFVDFIPIRMPLISSPLLR